MDAVAATFPIATLSDVHHDRSNLRTPRRKVTSLPNEILSSIRLLLVEHNSAGIQLPCRSFPLVCRQFRNLELSIPSLWTIVLDTMSPNRIEVQILRSGNLGLSFYITFTSTRRQDRIHTSSDRSCKSAQLEIIARYNDRWSRAIIDSKEHVLLLYGCMSDHGCFSVLKGVSFPSLESLEMCFDDRYGLFPIISTWSFPRLRHMKCRSIDDLPKVAFTNPLATLEIVERHRMVKLYTLAEFLTTLAGSQLASIKFDFYSSNCERPLDENKLPRLDLVTVKEFSLKIFSDVEIERTIMQLFERIRLPNVETVTIDISYQALQRHSFIEWCRSLNNPSLRTVSLVVGTGFSWHVTYEVRASVQTKLFAAMKSEFEGLAGRGSSGNVSLQITISDNPVY